VQLISLLAVVGPLPLIVFGAFADTMLPAAVLWIAAALFLLPPP
jgi:hypothetical protein